MISKAVKIKYLRIIIKHLYAKFVSNINNKVEIIFSCDAFRPLELHQTYITFYVDVTTHAHEL